MNYYKRHLGDYAKDTKPLSVYEHGVYTLLLDEYYAQERPIAVADIEDIIKPASPKERASLDKVLSKYFKRDGECWRHSYADRVICESQEKAIKNQTNGKKGGRPRKNETQMVYELEPSNNHDGYVSVSEKNLSHKPLAINQEKEKKPAIAVNLLEGVSEQVAQDFLKVRKAKRAPLTETAVEGIKREAAKAGLGLEAALKVCCERGWQAFKAEWYAQQAGAKPAVAPSPASLRRLT